MRLTTPLLLAILLVSSCLAIHFPIEHHKKTVKHLKANQWVFPLQGDINQYGEFFINITLGTPPQTLRVQVDSGSTDLVVFGTGCKGCPSATNVSYFDDSISKTLDHIGCGNQNYRCIKKDCDDGYCPFDDEYGGGASIQGYAEIDKFQVGNIAARVTFGNIQQLTGSFEDTGVDGIWGFAYDSLSSWGDMPVIAHMANEHKMYDSFSLCLTENDPVLDIGTNWQGNNQFDWTDITQQQWYTVEMEDFFVNGTSLNIDSIWLNWDGVIVDSGTTLFIVNSKIMAGIQKYLTAMCAHTPLVGVCNVTTQTLFNGYCFPMTDDQVAQFPSISTSLKGMSNQLEMSPQTYLWEGAGEEGVYCLGLQALASSGGIPVILGDIIMQNYHVVFDRKESKVGFGPLSTCPTPSSTTSGTAGSGGSIDGTSGNSMTSSSSGASISGSGSSSGGSSGGFHNNAPEAIYGGKGAPKVIKY